MLRENGINVYIGYDESYIYGDEIVIYIVVILKDNFEFIVVKRMNLKIYEWVEFLGFLMKNFKNVIVILGMYGKIIIIFMIGYILKKVSYNFIILVGVFVK